MKIYFAGSIRAGRGDAKRYAKMIDFLRTKGEVLTEHVGSEDLIENEKNLTDRFIHDRDMAWLKESDVVIAEVTTPSLGVGYEIAKGLDMGKKTLCIYRPAKCGWLSAMITGCPDVVLRDYEAVEEANAVMAEFLDS